MAQQTAVDYIIEQLLESGHLTIETTYYCKNLIRQAKQMEKQQRITDYNVGYQDAQCNHINDAENYANEQEYINL